MAKRVCCVALHGYSADKNAGSVAGGKKSSSCSILFPVYLKRRISANICFQIYFSLAKVFSLGNAEFTKTISSTRINRSCKQSSSTILSYGNWINAVLNLSKSFLAFKKVNPRILSTFKRSFPKKMGKTPSSHIIHSLGGEYCWIVRDSKPITLLKSPRSLSVYILILIIIIIRNYSNYEDGSTGLFRGNTVQVSAFATSALTKISGKGYHRCFI